MFVVGVDNYYEWWLFQSTSLRFQGIFHELITIIVTIMLLANAKCISRCTTTLQIK
jgi:hypothetical protein